mmetsp:Transcript_13767/g.25813  ORF Transcript_13767/g.25813 Transcript_13767/m.25813 type:complete len:245 (-) Transcript_13767:1-735(-)
MVSQEPPARALFEWGKFLGDELLVGNRGFNAQAPDSPLKEDKLHTVRTSHAITGALKLVMLYFSGRWCPLCTEFDSVVRDVYTGLKSLDESSFIEIVLVSCDLSDDAFKTHLKRIGSLLATTWSPKRMQEAMDNWQVKAIPTVLILDARDGRVVCATARRDMAEAHEKHMLGDSKDFRDNTSYATLMFRWLELLDEQRAALDDGLPIQNDDGSDSGTSSRHSRPSRGSSRRFSKGSQVPLAGTG